MKQARPDIGMDTLCGVLGVSRQAYYQHQKQEGRKALEEEVVLKEVQNIRKLQPKVGVRKLCLHLAEPLMRHGIEIGRDVLFGLLRSEGMLVRRRRRKAVTTDSDHPYLKYPNLIVGFTPLKANELWVCDITYVDTLEGFVYLFLITDAYSRKIVGWCLGETLEAKWGLAALRMALAQRTDKRPLIHHSDRGVQYCSHHYTQMLQHPDNAVRISMTENGDPYENAMAERVNGILKGELLPDTAESRPLAQQLVQQAIKTYNEVRLHSSVGMLTPQEAHQQSGPLDKMWKPQKLRTQMTTGGQDHSDTQRGSNPFTKNHQGQAPQICLKPSVNELHHPDQHTVNQFQD